MRGRSDRAKRCREGGDAGEVLQDKSFFSRAAARPPPQPSPVPGRASVARGFVNGEKAATCKKPSVVSHSRPLALIVQENRSDFRLARRLGLASVMIACLLGTLSIWLTYPVAVTFEDKPITCRR